MFKTYHQLNVLGSISITLFLLIVIAGLLLAGLYRRRFLNALEYSSLVNLGNLSSLLFKTHHACFSQMDNNLYCQLKTFVQDTTVLRKMLHDIIVQKAQKMLEVYQTLLPVREWGLGMRLYLEQFTQNNQS